VPRIYHALLDGAAGGKEGAILSRHLAEEALALRTGFFDDGYPSTVSPGWSGTRHIVAGRDEVVGSHKGGQHPESCRPKAKQKLKLIHKLRRVT